MKKLSFAVKLHGRERESTRSFEYRVSSWHFYTLINILNSLASYRREKESERARICVWIMQFFHSALPVTLPPIGSLPFSLDSRAWYTEIQLSSLLNRFIHTTTARAAVVMVQPPLSRENERGWAANLHFNLFNAHTHTRRWQKINKFIYISPWREIWIMMRRTQNKNYDPMSMLSRSFARAGSMRENYSQSILADSPVASKRARARGRETSF
jgi:hypothetical protein